VISVQGEMDERRERFQTHIILFQASKTGTVKAMESGVGP